MAVHPWQQRQWRQLQGIVAQGRVPHALLLAGPPGTGLPDFAAELAAWLLCSGDKGDAACGECRSCVLYRSGNHPDFYPAEPEEAGRQIKVETIRGMIDFIQLSSQYARYKIAVVQPAEAMNRSAANSLLKTLEEPPPASVIVLVSNQPAGLPVTIRSRCQRLDFSASFEPAAVEWLAGEANMAPERAAELLAVARGRPLHARDMAQTDALETRQRILADLTRLGHPSANVTAVAQAWHDYGAVEVFEWLLTLFTSMARLKILGRQASHQPAALNRDLQRITNQLNLRELVGCYDRALGAYRSLSGPYNLNKMSLLEEFIVNWQSMNRETGGRR